MGEQSFLKGQSHETLSLLSVSILTYWALAWAIPSCPMRWWLNCFRSYCRLQLPSHPSRVRQLGLFSKTLWNQVVQQLLSISSPTHSDLLTSISLFSSFSPIFPCLLFRECSVLWAHMYSCEVWTISVVLIKTKLPWVVVFSVSTQERYPIASD